MRRYAETLGSNRCLLGKRRRRAAEGQKRLAQLHAAMCSRCVETDLNKLIPEFACARPEQKRAQSAQIGAILDGLALNCMFDAGSLSEEQRLRLLQANLRVALRTD